MLRTCPKGHRYHKSSDCPTCPIFEQELRPESGFLSLLGAPARRAVENNGIITAQELLKLTIKEILSLQGLGKASIRTLQSMLTENGFNFKEK